MGRLSSQSQEFLDALRKAQGMPILPYEFNVLESVAAIELGLAKFVSSGVPQLQFKKFTRILPVGTKDAYAQAVTQAMSRGYVDLIPAPMAPWLPRCTSKASVFIGSLPLQMNKRFSEYAQAAKHKNQLRPFISADIPAAIRLDAEWRKSKGPGLLDADLYTWSIRNWELLRSACPDQDLQGGVAEFDDTAVAISLGARVSKTRWANVIRRHSFASPIKGVSSALFAYLSESLMPHYTQVNDGQGGGGLDDWKCRCGLVPKAEVLRLTKV